MRLIIEIITEDPEDTPADLWAAMLADQAEDPKHRLTLETSSFIADVKVIGTQGAGLSAARIMHQACMAAMGRPVMEKP